MFNKSDLLASVICKGIAVPLPRFILAPFIGCPLLFRVVRSEKETTTSNLISVIIECNKSHRHQSIRTSFYWNGRNAIVKGIVANYSCWVMQTEDSRVINNFVISLTSTQRSRNSTTTKLIIQRNLKLRFPPPLSFTSSTNVFAPLFQHFHSTQKTPTNISRQRKKCVRFGSNKSS